MNPSAPERGVRRPSLALLASASALSPFGMATVLPTLVVIGQTYGVDHSLAQFVISAYLFGLGITQPFSGVLCDRLGRRPVMIGGVVIFMLASIACMLATSFAALVAWRFVQAVGISVGTVASRAIIRDTHDAIDGVRALSVLAAGLGVAPVIAPFVGGLLGSRFGPAGVFGVTALLAGAVLAWMFFRLDETGGGRPAGDELPGIRSGYRELLRSREFVGNTLLFGFIQGTFFAFLGVGAIVFHDHLGLGQQVFGAVWGTLAIAYVASTVSAGRLAGRIGGYGVLRVGAYITFVAGWGIVVANLLAGTTLGTVVAPIFFLMIASGFITPLAMAGAVGGRTELAGRAAGLSGAVGLVLSGAFSIVSGVIYTGSFLPVTLLIAAAATLTAAMLPLTRPRG